MIGDFGTGIRRPSTPKRRQLEVAQALERAVDEFDVRLVLTTGDNIYASKRFLLWTAESGDEDDDWFFTYFQPYRYVINRVPWCPSIGNHDTHETEEHDDREQVMDNFYLRERLAGEEAAGRASVNPGLFYKFRVGSRHRVHLLRHVERGFFQKRAAVRISQALGLHATGLLRRRRTCPVANPVRPSSAVLRRSASMATPTAWAPSSISSRPAACAPASAATSTISSTRCWNGIDYFITGAGSKVRRRTPGGFEAAHTQTWSGECHFLLVTIEGATMSVRAVGESPGGRSATFRV